MTEKDLFEAIHECEDKWIEEVAEQESSGYRRLRTRGKMFAAAAAAAVVILGFGVTVAASTSQVFHDWLIATFTGQEVTRVQISGQPRQNPADGQADIKADENQYLSLEENTDIFGERESFVCQYHYEGENADMHVDKVYSIQEDGLKLQKPSVFSGEYEGMPFSFEYVIINEEIFGFNYTGSMANVFHHVNGDKIYAELEVLSDDGETVEKGCLAEINRKTGALKKLVDGLHGGSVMSPNGKVILRNYRQDGYWSMYDIASGTEKKVEEIHGYARPKEIQFVDDYHVLTFGEDIEEKVKTKKGNYVQLTSTTNLIDLRTQKIVGHYVGYGEIQMRWNCLWNEKKRRLKIEDIVKKESFVIEHVEDAATCCYSTHGDYVLLGPYNPDEVPAGVSLYICNLARKTSKKITVPKALGSDVQICLAVNEKKLLLTDGKECYLVDVSGL